MAAVTTTTYNTNVDGSYRQELYKITIANSGDTLATSLRSIQSVTFNDGAITKAAVSGGTITFTTTGAVTGALVNVIGV